MNAIRVSNDMDPDQDRHFVGLDLGPNCLQRLSADDKVATCKEGWNHYKAAWTTVYTVCIQACG